MRAKNQVGLEWIGTGFHCFFGPNRQQTGIPFPKFGRCEGAVSSLSVAIYTTPIQEIRPVPQDRFWLAIEPAVVISPLIVGRWESRSRSLIPKFFALCGKLTHFPPTPLPIPSQALRFAAVLSWEQPVLDVPGEGIMNTTIEHE